MQIPLSPCCLLIFKVVSIKFWYQVWFCSFVCDFLCWNQEFFSRSAVSDLLSKASRRTKCFQDWYNFLHLTMRACLCESVILHSVFRKCEHSITRQIFKGRGFTGINRMILSLTVFEIFKFTIGRYRNTLLHYTFGLTAEGSSGLGGGDVCQIKPSHNWIKSI